MRPGPAALTCMKTPDADSRAIPGGDVMSRFIAGV